MSCLVYYSYTLEVGVCYVHGQTTCQSKGGGFCVVGAGFDSLVLFFVRPLFVCCWVDVKLRIL